MVLNLNSFSWLTYTILVYIICTILCRYEDMQKRNVVATDGPRNFPCLCYLIHIKSRLAPSLPKWFSTVAHRCHNLKIYNVIYVHYKVWPIPPYKYIQSSIHVSSNLQTDIWIIIVMQSFYILDLVPFCYRQV